jgi:hypothetical protein
MAAGAALAITWRTLPEQPQRGCATASIRERARLGRGFRRLAEMNFHRKLAGFVGLDWAVPSFLFQTDRIDHIAAAATAAGTDRSMSRWKTKPTSQTEEEASPSTHKSQLSNLMT